MLVPELATCKPAHNNASRGEVERGRPTLASPTSQNSEAARSTSPFQLCKRPRQLPDSARGGGAEEAWHTRSAL